MDELKPEPQPEQDVVYDAATSARILSKRARRGFKRLLDGRSLLFCLVLALPFALLSAAAVAAIVRDAKGDAVDPALLAEAKALDLDYIAVAAAPHEYAGKPVYWCLMRDMVTRGIVVDGNVSQPVRIGGGEFGHENPTARMGRCYMTLAVIEADKTPGVQLRYVGQP